MLNVTEELVSSYKKSGLTQKDFCREKALPLSTLQYHLSKSQIDSLHQKQNFIPIHPTTSVNNKGTLIVYSQELSICEISKLLQTILK